MKNQSREDKIIHESPDKACYVYKLEEGVYEVRLNGPTYSKVIGCINMPDEDSDAKARAIDLCDSYEDTVRIIKKYCDQEKRA